MIERKTKRIAIILIGALISWVGLIAVAQASSEARRIDTENVVKSTDIFEQGAKNQDGKKGSGKVETDGDHGQPEESEPENEESEPHGKETESDSAGDESGEEHEEEEEEVHHPAWMIPGWQSIFTVLAVGYFALGVTFLPKIMAKEEHN